MRHRPARPAPRSRLRQLFPQRWALLPALVAAAVIGVLAVAVPLMSGAVGAGRVAVDSSSAPGYSPVVMGEDGVPDSSTAATGSRGGSRPSAGSETPSATAPGTGTSSADTPAGGPAGSAGSAGPVGSAAPRPSAVETSSSATTPDGTPSSTPESAAPDSTSASSSSAPSSSADPAPQTPAASVTDAVLGPIDRARAEQGCAPLRPDDALAAAALTNSTLMAARGTVAVLESAGSAAEVGAGPDAAAVVDGWLADSSDSAQLLDCSLTTAGVAEVTGPGGPWWTLFLA